MLARDFGQLASVHPRQADIGDHEVEPLAFFQYAYRLLPIGGFRGAIAQFLDNYVNLFEEVVSQPEWRLLDIPLDHRNNSIRPALVESAYQHQQFNF